MSGAEDRLDPTLSSPVRLRLCGYLSGCEEADFAAVQSYCAITASNLSKQLTVLLEKEYVALRKVPSGRYTRTRLSLTDHGRARLADHVRALQSIAADAAGSAAPDPGVRA